jgi:hypothetical protein
VRRIVYVQEASATPSVLMAARVARLSRIEGDLQPIARRWRRSWRTFGSFARAEAADLLGVSVRQLDRLIDA